MSVLGKYGAPAMKYWSSILASAYQGASTADMWNAIRDVQQSYGLSSPGASAPDVSVLRGYANRIVAASQSLATAAPTDVILPSMTAVAPYTDNTLQGIAANPTYMVRFQNTIQLPDGTVTTAWHTSVFTAAQMPPTVGELQDAIDTDGEELAAQGSESSINTPKGVSLGTSNLQITLV